MKLNERNVRRLDRLLRECHGEVRPDGPVDPLDVLVLTVLSQATNDKNRDVAFARLKKRFPRWEMVLDADLAEIQREIAPAGLSAVKSARIKALLEDVKRRNGELSLRNLADMPSDEAMEYLQSFKGIGPKTAACVLLFGLGRPQFPVDTHIWRISKRLGLVGPKATPEKTQDELGPFIPDDAVLRLHVNLIRHGRRVCRSRRPRCSECVLFSECNYPSLAGMDRA